MYDAERPGGVPEAYLLKTKKNADTTQCNLAPETSFAVACSSKTGL